jgi:hypothetical protein
MSLRTLRHALLLVLILLAWLGTVRLLMIILREGGPVDWTSSRDRWLLFEEVCVLCLDALLLAVARRLWWNRRAPAYTPDGARPLD